MKKNLLFLTALLAITIGAEAQTKQTTTTTTTVKTPPKKVVTTTKVQTKKTITTTKAPVKKTATVAKTISAPSGKQLLAQSDCLTCHKEQVKVVGPAYADVALKYPPTPANIDYLVGKVIAGGSGVWGQIPMAAHPALNKDQVKAMVKYILSIKKVDG